MDGSGHKMCELPPGGATRRPLDISLVDIGVGSDAAPILRGATLALPAGKLTALLGPSGAGKTTLLKVVAGLERPRTGRLRAGENVWSDGDSGVFVEIERREIGMVFQSYALWPHMTVFENIAFPLRVRQLRQSEIARRVRTVLDMVRLPDNKAKQYPSSLSGGEQQRVGLARALVYDPRLLLLDEPLANLDGPGREAIRTEIRELQQRTGVTTLYVTHDQVEALAVADNIAVMDRGRVVEIGSPRSIYEQPKTAFCARFFGASNALRGTFRKVTRSIELSGSVLDLSEYCLDLKDGTEVEILLRQEDIELTELDSGISGWFGRIVSTEYMGESLLCTIETDSISLIAAVPSALRVSIGDKVRAAIRPGRLKVFPVTA
jgi:iron(III) transport system ATP-binding protein